MGYCPFSVCAGSRYSKLYRDTVGLGVQQEGHDTARTRPRYDPARVRHKAQHERHGPARTRHGLCLAIQFCIVTGRVATRQAQTLRHGAPARTCERRHDREVPAVRSEGCDTVRPYTRHSAQQVPCDTAGGGPATRRPCATTWPAWAQCTLSVRAARVQGVHTVHLAQF